MIPLLVGAVALAALVPPTKPKQRPPRIALVSDTHISHVDSPGQAVYRQNLADVIAQVNAAKVDLVLIGGDLTDSGDGESLAEFREVAKRLRSPVRWVPGNHDCGGKLSAGADAAVTRQKLADYEDLVGRSFGIETVCGVRVIRLNASLLGSGLPAEARQWAMLEREAPRASAAPRVMLLHYPLFLNRPDETEGGYWNVDPVPRARLIALAARLGVRAVLSGHIHRRLETSVNGVMCFSALATSFGLPPGEEPPGWALVTVPVDGSARVEWRPAPMDKETNDN